MTTTITIIECSKCGRMTGNYISTDEDTALCQNCAGLLEAQWESTRD